MQRAHDLEPNEIANIAEFLIKDQMKALILWGNLVGGILGLLIVLLLEVSK